MRYPCLVVDDLRPCRTHDRQHAHCPCLVDEDLVRNESGDHRLPVVAVRDIVPVQPHNRIQFDVQIPRLTDDAVLAEFITPDFPGFIVLPEQQDRGYLVKSLLHGVHGQHVRIVADDLLPVLTAVGFRPHLGIADHFLLFNHDPRLFLHPPVIRIAEEHSGVLYDLRPDSALPVCPGIGIRVPPGVDASVAPDGGVPCELFRQSGEPHLFGQGVEFLIDDPHRVDQFVIFGIGRKRRRRDLDAVGNHVRNDETRDSFQHIELWSRQAVGNDSFPLFSDVKILVRFYALLDLEYRVVRDCPLVLCPSPFDCRFVLSVKQAQTFFTHVSFTSTLGFP